MPSIFVWQLLNYTAYYRLAACRSESKQTLLKGTCVCFWLTQMHTDSFLIWLISKSFRLFLHPNVRFVSSSLAWDTRAHTHVLNIIFVGFLFELLTTRFHFHSTIAVIQTAVPLAWFCTSFGFHLSLIFLSSFSNSLFPASSSDTFDTVWFCLLMSPFRSLSDSERALLQEQNLLVRLFSSTVTFVNFVRSQVNILRYLSPVALFYSQKNTTFKKECVHVSLVLTIFFA